MFNVDFNFQIGIPPREAPADLSIEIRLSRNHFPNGRRVYSAELLELPLRLNLCTVLNGNLFPRFFRALHILSPKILRNFRELLKIRAKFTDFEQFPSIPWNSGKNLWNLHRKNAESNEKLQTSAKFCEILTKFWTLVRRFAKFLRFSWRILYSLKNAAKCAYSRYRSCPYSRERASESPENPRKKFYLKQCRYALRWDGNDAESACHRQQLLRMRHRALSVTGPWRRMRCLRWRSSGIWWIE